jgi:hypothetical protein
VGINKYSKVCVLLYEQFHTTCCDKILGVWAKKITIEGCKQSTLHYVMCRCYCNVLNLTIFFEEPLIRVMIQNWLIPELTNTDIMELVWFQHDGALADFVLTVIIIINRSFGDGGLFVHLKHDCHHCCGLT